LELARLKRGWKTDRESNIKKILRDLYFSNGCSYGVLWRFDPRNHMYVLFFLFMMRYVLVYFVIKKLNLGIK